MFKFKCVEKKTEEETQKKIIFVLEYEGRIMDGLPNLAHDLQ